MTEKELLTIISSVSETEQMPIALVGGAVRDALLGDRLPRQEFLEENKVQAALERDIVEGGVEVIVEEKKRVTDLDFVVVGSGIAFAKKLDELMKEEGSLVEFPDFDTARYVLPDIELEFAGARSESYEEGSRKPIVVPATLESDLSRRDFTVNAMAQMVETGGVLGKIVDPFDGQGDLKKGVLRTPLDPDVTFSEDPLRMLRAARFASQLGFVIEEETLASIKKQKDRLNIVSKERIAEEFFKLLGTPVPSVGLWILMETGLMDIFLPEVSELRGVEEVYGHTHKENLKHTFQVVDNLATRTHKPMLRYAGLMHDIGKPGTKEFHPGRGWTFDMHEHLGRKIVRTVGKRLHMSKADTEYVAHLVRWHQQPIQLMDDIVTDTPVRRLVVDLGDSIDDLLKLCRSDITTGNPERLKKRLKNYDILEAKIIEVIDKDKLRAFQSPLRGEEIMALTGLKPGPTVGKIKKAIEEAILEGDIKNELDAAKGYFESHKEEWLKDVAEWEKQK